MSSAQPSKASSDLSPQDALFRLNGGSLKSHECYAALDRECSAALKDQENGRQRLEYAAMVINTWPIVPDAVG